MKTLIGGIFLTLFLVGALALFLCRRKGDDDKEAGIQIRQDDHE